METDFFRREYMDQTTVHPVGLAALFVLGLAMVLLPRRYALWPMIAMACFIAPAQRVAVFSLDFNFLRIITLFGWLSLCRHGIPRDFKWKSLDSLMAAWSGCSLLTYTLLWGTTSAFVFKLGNVFDALGMYFLFRLLIRNWSDFDFVITGFAVASIPVAVAFAVEHATGRNLFAVFGGVPELTVVRNDRMRCQGAFSHPITAGCFWASLIPLFAAYWWHNRTWISISGCAASLLIVVFCASSTPVSAVIAAAVAGLAFFVRQYMRLIRWSLCIVLCSLHLVMNAPVWHLISRVDLAGGSTSYHRYVLIDQAIRRLNEWWLFGSKSTAHWGWDTWDVTNQYVLVAVEGGFASLVLFTMLIAMAFANVGMLWQRLGRDSVRTKIAWALGVALFTHCVSFVGVSYFGQILLVWYLLLAVIGSLTPDPVKLSTRRRALCDTGLQPVLMPGSSIPEVLDGSSGR